MTSEIARASAGSPRRVAEPGVRGLAVFLAVAASGCSSFVEVPVETPLQSKLDVSSFRRVLIAGFATDLVDADVDLSSETARLLQNQLRNTARLQVIEPDRPPLQDAIERILGTMGDQGKYSKGERDQYKLEVDRVLQDGDFWRKVGEEYQQPLIVTGRLGFEAQNRSGFQPEERVVRDSRNRPQLVRGNRYTERKGYALSADFYFVDGRDRPDPPQGEVHGGGPLQRGPEDLGAFLVLRAHGPAPAQFPGGDLAPADPRDARPPEIGRPQ